MFLKRADKIVKSVPYVFGFILCMHVCVCLCRVSGISPARCDVFVN